MRWSDHERVKDEIIIIFPSHVVSSHFNVKGPAGPIGSRGDPGFEGPVVSYLEYLWIVPIR